MTKFQQIERIHRLFTTRRRKLTLGAISDDLKIEADATQELIDWMRDYLDAPIELSDEGLGYAEDTDHKYQLPSFWLNPEEFAQTTRLLQTLGNTNPGLLHDDLLTLEAPINRLLRHRKISLYQFERRVKYCSDDQPYCFSPHLCHIAQGLIDRRQLAISYQDPYESQQNLNICPQMLSYRAGSWQLAAWCHRQHQLRCFDVARIESAEVLNERSREIAPKNIEKFFANQFGYNQQQPLTLELQFSGDNAHQVACQCWHPDQKGMWRDKVYHLSLPLIDQDLLLARLLTHLPNVQVISPEPFAERFKNILERALERQQAPVSHRETAEPAATASDDRYNQGPQQHTYLA